MFYCFFPPALCVTGGAEQENQQIFMDPLRQAILHSLYIIDQLMQLSYLIPEETAIKRLH